MNFSQEEFKIELRESLMSIRPLHKVNDNQFAIRCPICGDSRKSRTRTRFYIYMNENEPVTYYCFNCNETGLLSPSVLRNLDIGDLDILSGLKAYNKRMVKGNKKFKPTSEKIELKIPDPDADDDSNIIKRNYIRDRIGVDLSFKELVGMKTVFRLGELLLENKIEELTVSGTKALDIHENYVGFLTTNNETINARQVISKNSKGRRYEKYSLYKNRLDTLRFYTIPTVVDIMDKERITIDIAEGVFDIYGVYYNIHGGGIDNHVYMAVCGSGYKSVLEYIIRQGMIDTNINIYRDGDQDIELYQHLKKEYGIWFNEFNVYSNTLEKDFGYPKEKINMVKNKI